MATFPKIADNEMNYYQFRAQQVLKLNDENQQWEKFSSRSKPDCAACLAEKIASKGFKDIGVQAIPKKPANETKRVSFEPRKQDDQVEALLDIKTRLEKIDLALSQLYDETYKESERNPELCERSYISDKPAYSKEKNTAIPHEEQRKLIIQNSLRTTLQKLHGAGTAMPQKKPVAKPKNSSFFLPHDLQVKRAAARKAYLASLQTKPKMTVQSVKQSNINIAQTGMNKKSVCSRKKTMTKKIDQKLNTVDEETMVKALDTDDIKDDNIESLTDAILEDLLKEAAFDLNTIKQRCSEKNHLAQNHKPDGEKVKDSVIFESTLTSMKNFDPNISGRDYNKGIGKLKLFMNSQLESRSLRKGQLIDKSTSPPSIKVSKALNVKSTVKEVSSAVAETHVQTEIKAPPKFVCGISQILTIDSALAKSISHNRDKFWRYLESISRIEKGDFNPWILNEVLAESILDDCISDIAVELSKMPSSIIQDIYNQEFQQQVET